MTSLHVIILITGRATPVNWPARGKRELDRSRKEKKSKRKEKDENLQIKELERLGNGSEGVREVGKIECERVRERQRRVRRERKADQLFILQSH